MKEIHEFLLKLKALGKQADIAFRLRHDSEDLELIVQWPEDGRMRGYLTLADMSHGLVQPDGEMGMVFFGILESIERERG